MKFKTFVFGRITFILQTLHHFMAVKVKFINNGKKTSEIRVKK